MTTNRPIIHAVAENTSHQLDQSWQLIAPASGFKGLRIEKRGGMWRIPGSCLVNFNMQKSGARIVASLPPGVSVPREGVATTGLAIFKNGVRYVYQMLVNYLGQIVIMTNSGGIANFYFSDLIWFEDECK
ncbi:hypothetical protein CJ240_05840 [Varibaculum cambriense]|uniref:Uncharacterized protein n=1 Tax=Varibaculum cambriense TaxID=184870 RepID=A0ABX4UPD7_9ACTO|nr:hypothetical protein CJ240_05840 [Varibaculum cambriense]